MTLHGNIVLLPEHLHSRSIRAPLCSPISMIKDIIKDFEDLASGQSDCAFESHHINGSDFADRGS